MLLADGATRPLIGTAEAVEALLARSALQRAGEGGADIDAARLVAIDEQYRRVADSLLEATRVVLYGADQPVTDWWWRVAELSGGPSADRFVDVSEAAREKKVHAHTVRAAIHSGELPARRLSRSFLIHELDLRRWQPRPVGRPSLQPRRDSDELLAAFNEANTRKNWSRARELAQLLAERPTTGRRCLALALDAFNRGEPESALRWVAAARERGLDGRALATAAIAASASLVQLRRGEEALRELDLIEAPTELRFPFVGARVDALLEVGHIDEARKAAARALEEVPAEPASRLLAARVEFHADQPVQALQHIVVFRQHEPSDSEGLMLHGSILGSLADALGNRELYLEALGLFRRARATEGARATTKIGLCLARIGKWRLALRIARSLRTSGARKGAEAIVRAALRAAESRTDREELAEAVTLAERWTGDSAWTRLHRAYLLGMEGQWLDASRLIDETGIEQHYDDLELELLRATAMVSANMIADARELLVKLPLRGGPFEHLPELLRIHLLLASGDDLDEVRRSDELSETLKQLAEVPVPLGLLAREWMEREAFHRQRSDDLSAGFIMSLLEAANASGTASAPHWDVYHRRVSNPTARVASHAVS